MKTYSFSWAIGPIMILGRRRNVIKATVKLLKQSSDKLWRHNCSGCSYYMVIFIITAIPSGAYVRVGECRFERDTCDWYNDTIQEKSSASWRLATVSRRPANLPDKTFGAPGNNSTAKYATI